MPTILRFRGFNILIFTHDHDPAHVHAWKPDRVAIFNLNCGGGPVTLRGSLRTTRVEEALLARFIEENRDILCKAWEEFHGR